jgi:hypothetical protein
MGAYDFEVLKDAGSLPRNKHLYCRTPVPLRRRSPSWQTRLTSRAIKFLSGMRPAELSILIGVATLQRSGNAGSFGVLQYLHPGVPSAILEAR